VRPATLAAVDLGAESTRVAACRYDGERLVIESPTRFATPSTRLGRTVHWDAPVVIERIRSALQVLDLGAGDSIGVDGWGVDYALLDRAGQLVELPRSYRTPGTGGIPELVDGIVGARRLYDITGVQRMPINTLYQLVARRHTRELQAASRLVLFPDYMLHTLGGSIACEETNASTTQLVDIRSGDWSSELIDALSLPRALFPRIAPCGEVAGTTDGGATLIRVASHDTACAVLAANATRDGAYLISGTWSLVGSSLPAPLMSADAYALNFTNERGFAGTTRLLKNVMGLWLLQQCRAAWGNELRYPEIIADAQDAPSGMSLFEPDLEIFLTPGDMPGRIAEVCRETGQREPSTPGEFARAICESLACKYRYVVEQLDALVGYRSLLTIVGGGVSNALLCQLTADVTERPVVTRGQEASLLGNAIVQLVARGELHTNDIPALIARSAPSGAFEPRATGGDLYERYSTLWPAARRNDDRFKEDTWLAATPTNVS
jgi:rhamnulokinase